MVNGVSGSSVVAFKFKDGVLLVADTNVSYGSLAIPKVTKIFKFNKNSAVAFSGQYADILFIKNFLEQEIAKDSMPIDPQGIHKLLQRLIYSHRSRGSILDVSAVVAGVHKKQNTVLKSTDDLGRVLGVVNKTGNFWFDSCAATGIASHLVLPILREYNFDTMTKAEAITLAEEAMRLLFYKDCRAINSIQIAICEEEKIEILKPYSIKTNWEIGIMEGEIILE